MSASKRQESGKLAGHTYSEWSDDEEREFQAAMKAACNRSASVKRTELLEPYAVIPLRLAQPGHLSGAQWCVFLHLFYNQSVLNKGGRIPATAKTTGCARARTRTETLRRLEKLGLAKIEQRGNGACPFGRKPCPFVQPVPSIISCYFLPIKKETAIS
jgi:hypothetical protein